MTQERQTSNEQDALRLLIVLAAAAGPVSPGAPPGAVGELHAESRLQALDFWLRSPDYLAHELLALYRAGGRSDKTLLVQARQVLQDDQLDLRTFPMLRYLFGAWEEISNPFSLLSSYDLARVVRQGRDQMRRRDFFLMPKGRSFIDALPTKAPELSWYVERAALVARVAGDRGGDALKQQQKLQREYRLTKWGRRIGPITELVADELAQEDA